MCSVNPVFRLQIELEQMRREEAKPVDQQTVVVKKTTSTKPKTASPNENVEGKNARPKNAPAPTPASASSTTESASKQSKAHYVC